MSDDTRWRVFYAWGVGGFVWCASVGVWALTGFKGGIDGLIEGVFTVAVALGDFVGHFVGVLLGGLLIVQLFGLPVVTVFALLIAGLAHIRDRKDAKLRRALEAAQFLTTAYSRILQTPRDHFWPLSALPADKETMKAALKMDAAYQASQGALDQPLEGGRMTLRHTYIGTYASLADFVPDELAGRVNPYWKFIRAQAERMRTGEELDEETAAATPEALAPSDEDWHEIERIQPEFAALADEMDAYLDRIAPRKES